MRAVGASGELFGVGRGQCGLDVVAERCDARMQVERGRQRGDRIVEQDEKAVGVVDLAARAGEEQLARGVGEAREHDAGAAVAERLDQRCAVDEVDAEQADPPAGCGIRSVLGWSLQRHDPPLNLPQVTPW